MSAVQKLYHIKNEGSAATKKGDKMKKKKQYMNNNSGIVLVTVVMVILVLTVLTISVMSSNVSQITLTKSVENRIKTEQLSKGAMWLNYTNIMTGAAGTQTVNETLDGKTYNISTTHKQGDGSGPNTTDPLQMTSSY